MISWVVVYNGLYWTAATHEHERWSDNLSKARRYARKSSAVSGVVHLQKSTGDFDRDRFEVRQID
jgi:hypothetical protein